MFGVSLFTTAEAEEIHHLKSLALSVLEKSPEIIGKPVICEAIRNGQKAGLDAFAKQASQEMVAAGVVNAVY